VNGRKIYDKGSLYNRGRVIRANPKRIIERDTLSEASTKVVREILRRSRERNGHLGTEDAADQGNTNRSRRMCRKKYPDNTVT
jgi:hypothetical protein